MSKIKDLKILLWDIETLPMMSFTWGMWKQNINASQIVKDISIICISYKWLHSNKVHTISIGDNRRLYLRDPYLGGKEVAHRFMSILNKADFAVAHNGDKFDYKHLKAQAVMHGYEPFRARTVDTLKMAKTAGLFPRGNKLDNLASVMGISGKSKTSMDMWTDIALHSSQHALAKMERYCEQDVNVLEKVFLKLWPHSESVLPNIHVLSGGDPKDEGCTKCGSTNKIKDGRYIKNVLVYQRYICKDCGACYIGRKALDITT